MKEGQKQCRAMVQRRADPRPRRCTHAAAEGGYCLKHGATAKKKREARESARALRTIKGLLRKLTNAGAAEVAKLAGKGA